MHCFFQFFIDKVIKLKNSVSDTLRSLPASLPSSKSFPSHCGPIFDILSPVTADEVRKLLSSSLPKSSVMDIIPTSLILGCQEVFSEIIAHLANLSFSEGRFPDKFKQASVTPSLKGRSLDKSVPSNYTYQFLI